MNICCDDILYDPEGQNASRELFTAESCESLAKTIEKQGLTHPVSVVPLHPDREKKYKLIAGFRRFVAIAHILGRKEIPCVVREDVKTLEEELLVNALENLERKDMSYWEECLMLKKVFPPDTKMTYIGEKMGKTRSWVRRRWLIWKMPQEVQDEVIPMIREGLLIASDVELIILREQQDQIAAMKALLQGHREGKAIRKTSREITKRKVVRGLKEIQRAMTVMMDNNKPDCVHFGRFACGEITDEQLYKYLGCEERSIGDSGTDCDESRNSLRDNNSATGDSSDQDAE